jgi:PAS domain S-box
VKVFDIMTPAKNNANISTLAWLDSGQDVLSLADISGLPPVIGVRNKQGQAIGSVDRDNLLFLRKTCDSWVLGQIADRYHEGIVAVDATGRIFYVNDAYTQILGVTKHNVIGKQLQEIEPGATVLTVLQDGEPVLEKAVQIKSVNRHVVVNIYPLKRDGKLAAVVSIFRDVTETKRLNLALDRAHGLAEYFRQQLTEQDELEKNRIVGKHPLFLKTVAQALTVAKTDAPVLLGGENGAGKDVLAKLIHQNSVRSQKPLITVNCAAIPETLLESELFGYEDGSFTGARRGGKLGKFELADGGTLFLDEIGDMPLIMQSKILRVLQEKEIEKIGRSQTVPVDVRILAATNRRLEEMVAAGTFRRDLYYRLNVVGVMIPPLRERGEDIGLLAYYFLTQCNAKYKKRLVFSPEVVRVFKDHDWPGNVRELQNCVEHAVIMCPEGEIGLSHLPAHVHAGICDGGTAEPVTPSELIPLKEGLQAAEKALIERALAACGNNRSQAMKLLHISRRAFYRKLNQYKLL